MGLELNALETISAVWGHSPGSYYVCGIGSSSVVKFFTSGGVHARHLKMLSTLQWGSHLALITLGGRKFLRFFGVPPSCILSPSTNCINTLQEKQCFSLVRGLKIQQHWIEVRTSWVISGHCVAKPKQVELRWPKPELNWVVLDLLGAMCAASWAILGCFRGSWVLFVFVLVSLSGPLTSQPPHFPIGFYFAFIIIAPIHPPPP
jgi:hypothetical protein